MAAARVGRAANAERRRALPPIGRRAVLLLLGSQTGFTTPFASSHGDVRTSAVAMSSGCSAPDGTSLRIVSLVPAVTRTRVDELWAVGVLPPVVAGPGGLPDDPITVAGGRNLFADAYAPWLRPSTEQRVARASLADVVVWPVGGDPPAPEDLPPESPWHALLKRSGARVVEVDAELVREAGPTLARAAELLARQRETHEATAASTSSFDSSDSET